MILWGLKTCDTCRKALRALSDAGHAPAFRDVRADGLPDDLADWIAEFGTQALINRRSTTWTSLDERVRADADDPAAALALLRDHPTLAKRPLIEDGATRSVGWATAQRAFYI